MALSVPSFAFGSGFTAKTPQAVARNRAIYQAMLTRSAPKDVGSGLTRVGEAIVARMAMDKATEGETAGLANAQSVYSGLQDGYDPAELSAAMSDPWVQANPGMAATVGALQARQLSQSDPEYQLDMDLKRAQLAAATAPSPPEAPKIEEQYDPATGRTTKKQWNPATGQWDEFGGIEAPKEPLVSIDMSDGGADAEFYKAGSKSRGDQMAAIETAGYQAQAKIGQINRLEQLMGSAPQGIEGAWKQFAGELGVPSEGLDDIQSAQALISAMVPAQRPPGSGTMSDADLALFKSSLPRIINQPGGNALTVQTLKGIAVYEQTMGEIATKVLNKEMTPAEGRAAMASVQNPLELFRKDGGSSSDQPPEGVDAAVWSAMSEEDRALWN